MPKASPSPKILTLDEVRKRVKPNAIVLWPYRDCVEEGTVLSVRGDQAALVWLEGYKSRNDDVPFNEILSVHDPKGPELSLFPFKGKGYLTEAGVRWLETHPRETESAS